MTDTELQKKWEADARARCQRIVDKWYAYIDTYSTSPSVPYGSMCKPLVGISPTGKKYEHRSLREAAKRHHLTVYSIRESCQTGEEAPNGWRWTYATAEED